MFFLKKLLQYIEQKGFRAGTDGADKRSVAIAAPAKPAGRAVRRENGEQGFAGNRRGRVAAESAYAAGGEPRRAEAEQFAWYFAVRDFFARSSRGKQTVCRAERECLRAAWGGDDLAGRTICADGPLSPRKISFGGESVPPRGASGREEAYISPRSAEGDSDSLIFDDEFFAGLASLRGLNVEERRRRGF